MSTVIHQPSTYVPESTGPEVSFLVKGIGPPSNLYVGREDVGSITSYSSASGLTLEVHGRLLRPDGVVVPFVQAHQPNSNRTAKTDTFALPEGFLLNIAVFLSVGSAQRGQCYVVLKLGRGSGAARIDHQVILQGYVGNNVNQAWPGNRLETPTEGPGWIRTYTGTQPAAGADILETVPTGARWRIMTAAMKLTASAGAANRYVEIQMQAGGTVVYSAPPQVAETASQASTYYAGAGLPVFTPLNNLHYSVPIPNQLYLPAAGTVGTATVNLQAGDQWTAPQILIEEWIEP